MNSSDVSAVQIAVDAYCVGLILLILDSGFTAKLNAPDPGSRASACSCALRGTKKCGP